MNTGNVGRGDTVAVIGCGGVGYAAIAGARLAGAPTIIAVDVDDREARLGQGPRRHPHRQVNGKSEDEVVAAIQGLTDGFGADVVIDAVGRPETWQQAFYARDLAGTVVLVGVPTPDMRLELPLLDVFGRGGCAQVLAGTATACPAATSRCWSTCTCRAGCRSSVRLRDDRPRRRRGGVREDARRRRAALGGRAVTAACGSSTSSPPGTFSLDGGTWDVDNNVWLVGDDDECVVIDAAHDADAIAGAGRPAGRCWPIVCTHAHDDHVRVAARAGRPLRRADPAAPGRPPLWELTHPDRAPDADLADGRRSTSPASDLEVLHTPGHSPGRGLLPVAGARAGLHRRHAVRRAARARPAGRTRTSRRSSTRSATGC